MNSEDLLKWVERREAHLISLQNAVTVTKSTKLEVRNRGKKLRKSKQSWLAKNDTNKHNILVTGYDLNSCDFERTELLKCLMKLNGIELGQCEFYSYVCKLHNNKDGTYRVIRYVSDNPMFVKWCNVRRQGNEHIGKIRIRWKFKSPNKFQHIRT